MAYQAVFKRHELKYMLSCQQKQRLLEAMEPYMALDQYGKVTIRNIYFDTDHYRLIRHSMERPTYKEKLRLRSYAPAAPDSPIFVELKKKYNSVVYKRRLSMPQQQALDWLCGQATLAPASQIGAELEYFRNFYSTLQPKVFLSYNREAYYCREGGDFRVTFDDSILARQDMLSLVAPVGGAPLLNDNLVLLELKTAGDIPLWMTEFLTREKLFKTSFSKYGTAYTTIIFPHCKGGSIYA